jgi:hypothetical protein
MWIIVGSPSLLASRVHGSRIRDNSLTWLEHIFVEFLILYTCLAGFRPELVFFCEDHTNTLLDTLISVNFRRKQVEFLH